MLLGEKLAIQAMKKELIRLQRIAGKAMKEANEYEDITSEFISINEEFAQIVESKEESKVTLKKLEDLSSRRDKAMKILNKDFIKLLDKQHEAESNRNALAGEIHKMEWRISLRK
ncbi:MAG: hypothetical protein IBX55_00595 [Methyloprofundus sp.]|nr:hypothetical protein [Methyloprofundus sp.]